MPQMLLGLTQSSLLFQKYWFLFLFYFAQSIQIKQEKFCIYFWDHSGKYEMVYSSKYYRFCVFLLYLMGSRYGLLKFGKDDDKPEYSFFAWISMLFSCAMGVGLVLGCC